MRFDENGLIALWLGRHGRLPFRFFSHRDSASAERAPEGRKSGLARRTEEGGAAGLHLPLDLATATRRGTGFALAVIDAERVLEIAERAILMAKIAKGEPPAAIASSSTARISLARRVASFGSELRAAR